MINEHPTVLQKTKQMAIAMLSQSPSNHTLVDAVLRCSKLDLVRSGCMRVCGCVCVCVCVRVRVCILYVCMDTHNSP
jgi:hypothetical protein